MSGEANSFGDASQQLKVSNFNIANVLTILRLVLVPVFIYLMLLGGQVPRWWALGVFVIAALTDKFDGMLARKYGLITDFGKLADSIADKALVISAFVLLSAQGLLGWWVTILILLRELGITVMRFFMLKIIVMPANKGGKLKTVLQMLLIIFLLVPWKVLVPQVWPTVEVFVLIASVLVVLVTLGTGLWYVGEAVVLYRRASGRVSGE